MNPELSDFILTCSPLIQSFVSIAGFEPTIPNSLHLASHQLITRESYIDLFKTPIVVYPQFCGTRYLLLVSHPTSDFTVCPYRHIKERFLCKYTKNKLKGYNFFTLF